MTKQVKIKNFTQVKNIVNAASSCYNDIGIHDQNGAIADAKSILGLMSLDYTQPVSIVTEDSVAMDKLLSVLN